MPQTDLRGRTAEDQGEAADRPKLRPSMPDGSATVRQLSVQTLHSLVARGKRLPEEPVLRTPRAVRRHLAHPVVQNRRPLQASLPRALAGHFDRALARYSQSAIRG